MSKNMVLAVLLLLSFACLPIKGYASSMDCYKVPSVEVVNNIHFLTLDAPTSYGRGFQHGAAMKYVIHKGIAQWKQWILTTLGEINVEIEIAEFIQDTDYLTGIRNHTPELYEELQGIAYGAEVDFNTLYAYQMFDEMVLYVTKKYRLEHCTGVGLYGRKDKPNIIGQNNDLPPYYEGTHTVLDIQYPTGLKALVFTWAGCLAQNGVNNKSLGVTMNIVPTAEGNISGVPMPYIIRSILTKENVGEAVSFLKSLGKSAAPMNFIIGDPEQVVTVENTATGAKVFKDFHGEKWVAHANHQLDMDVTQLKPGAVSKTVERQKTTETALKGKVHRLTAKDIMKLFRTKPILKNRRTDPGFPTMESIVIELYADKPQMHVAPGPPDSNKYSTFDFSKGYVGTEK